MRAGPGRLLFQLIDLGLIRDGRIGVVLGHCRYNEQGDARRHLSGRVADVAFRGCEHAIDINENTRLTGVFARARAARGETVGLRLDPAGCHVFPGVSPDQN